MFHVSHVCCVIRFLRVVCVCVRVRVDARLRVCGRCAECLGMRMLSFRLGFQSSGQHHV